MSPLATFVFLAAAMVIAAVLIATAGRALARPCGDAQFGIRRGGTASQLHLVLDLRTQPDSVSSRSGLSALRSPGAGVRWSMR